MSIIFTKDGTNFELSLNGLVKSGGIDFGSWVINEDNNFQITATSGGAVFTQLARWSTKDNRLSVEPNGGAAVEFLDATDGNIQFRIANNRLVVDPLPIEDDFCFTLFGDWSLSDDYSSLQLAMGHDILGFTGGLNDSQSRFIWQFEAENDSIKKIFSLHFDGTWQIQKGTGDKAILAVFAFEYTLKGQTTHDTFKLPVEVTADTDNGNRLMLTYNREGSDTQWGVAFAGRFTTKGSSIIGYSAEVYDDNGKITSRFTFSLKGKIKDGSVATRNSLQFEAIIAGQTVNLTLSGRYNFTKSSLSFSLQLNTSTRTGDISSLTFGLTYNNTYNGSNVILSVKADKSTVTISVRAGIDIILGGSRKGNVYGGLDMKYNGQSYGISALLGITLN